MPIAADTTKRSVMLAMLPYLLVAVFAWVGYFNSLDVPFTFDDESNIGKNQSVLITDLSPGSLAQAAFGSSHPTPRPVAYLTFGLNHYFGQLDVVGYHIVNIVIHTINGWLVFVLALHLCPLLIRRTKEAPRSVHVLFALAVALIFISHPVQTQAVTYIVQRMTSLCTLFYLAGLLCYIRGRCIEASVIRLRAVWWSLAFVCWVLAIGTKQFAVTLPLAIMLYEWVARGEQFKIQKKTIAAIGGGAVLMLLAVVVFKGGVLSNKGTLTELLTSGYDNRDFTLTERLMTESRVVMHYISLLVWPPPSRLVLIYDYPISTSLVTPFSTILSILGLGAMTVASAVFARRLPLVAFGVLWFMLHLAVESTIIPLEIAYEHRLYMPLIGAGLLFVGGVFALIKNPKAAFALVFVISAVMLVGTHQRNETWRSALGIWEDNAKKQPTEFRAFFNMAVIHKDDGRYTEAIDLLQQTIELEPRHQEAMVRAGALLKLSGRYQESANAYTAAIAFDRDEHPRFAACSIGKPPVIFRGGYCFCSQAVLLWPKVSPLRVCRQCSEIGSHRWHICRLY